MTGLRRAFLYLLPRVKMSRSHLTLSQISMRPPLLGPNSILAEPRLKVSTFLQAEHGSTRKSNKMKIRMFRKMQKFSMETPCPLRLNIRVFCRLPIILTCLRIYKRQLREMGNIKVPFTSTPKAWKSAVNQGMNSLTALPRSTSKTALISVSLGAI